MGRTLTKLGAQTITGPPTVSSPQPSATEWAQIHTTIKDFQPTPEPLQLLSQTSGTGLPSLDPTTGPSPSPPTTTNQGPACHHRIPPRDHHHHRQQVRATSQLHLVTHLFWNVFTLKACLYPSHEYHPATSLHTQQMHTAPHTYISIRTLQLSI